jgi:hypothetical protein
MKWPRPALLLAPVIAVAGAVCAIEAREAGAQRLDPRRPSVFVVGAPSGPSPMQRVDARRSGQSRQPLPSGTLRIAWRKTIGLTVEHPALAAADGTLALVTASRGDVIFLDGDGEEKARVSVDGRPAGAAALTSDGTVVFSTSAGDAVGVRRTSARPRFVTRIGGERNARAAPLALDDGGVVIATTYDLVVLDAEGNVRSRVSLPEAIAAPLVASGDRVLAVTATGAVWGWTPGREPVRLGSFGAPIDGGAALTEPTTLLAVVEGNQIVELDLATGSRATRAIAAQGLYLGPPAVRRAPSGFAATVLALTPNRGFVVTVDPGGQETQRAPIASLTPSTLADGGPAPLVAPPHTGPIIDARGAVAFAATDGHVGLVTPEGAVETIGERLCAQSGRSAGIAGLTPYGRGSFVVTCEGGSLTRIVGPEADSLRRPAPQAQPPARPGPPPTSSPED